MPDATNRDHIPDVPPAIQPGGVEAMAQVPTVEASAAERVLSTRQLSWRRFKRHKLAIGSAVVLILMALATIVIPMVSKYSYREQGLLNTLKGPTGHHFFGTDTLGRDEFTRVVYGGRISLLVGLSVALLAGTIGAFTGAIAGFYGGLLDNILMRVTDLFLAIPFLVILILAAKIFGGSVFDIVLILSLFFWMPEARIVRGVFLSMKEKEFVEAARASGASNSRIIFYHMLPNALGPITVIVTLGVAAAIITESALSFLGFGIQPPTPTWGNLLNDSTNVTLIAPWLVYFPGLFILITVLCVNFLGDGLRDALDPRQELKQSV